MERFECMFCGAKTPVDVFHTFCPHCQEPLLCCESPEEKKIREDRKNVLEIFTDFLPVSTLNRNLLLGEGSTPFIHLERIGKKMGFSYLFAKNECTNPTGSFKDRGTVLAVQKAISLKIRNIGTVSTGNMAASTAAYGARAGLRTIVLIKDDVSTEKLLSTGIYGPAMIRVQGDYGELTYRSFELGRRNNIYFMNSVDPYRLEGYKITGLEIFLHSRPNPPQYIFVPVSSGGHLIGLMRAFLQLKREGFTDRMPVFVGVQARGCAPIAQAFKQKKQRVERIEYVRTIAQAITNPNPPGGNLLLKLLKENNGLMIDVTDDEIIAAQRMLAAHEGIFCLPASATVLAGFMKLALEKLLQKRDRIAFVLTGTGLKNLKHLVSMPMNFFSSTLDDLEGTLLGALENRP